MLVAMTVVLLRPELQLSCNGGGVVEPGRDHDSKPGHVDHLDLGHEYEPGDGEPWACCW